MSDDVAIHITRVLKNILSDYQEGPSRAQLTCKTKQNGRGTGGEERSTLQEWYNNSTFIDRITDIFWGKI